MNQLGDTQIDVIDPRTPFAAAWRVAGLLLAAIAVAAVVIVSTPVAAEAAPQSPDEALVRDAQEYAAYYGVSLDEAVRRLELQGSIGALNAKLLADEAASFGGLWIQHEPEFQVVAQFTRDQAKLLNSLVAGGPLEGVVKERIVTQPVALLENKQLTAARQVAALGIPVESGLDIAHNLVRLYVTDPGRLDRAIQAGRIRLPEGTEVVQVRSLSIPTLEIYGGHSLSDCTAGFSVIDYGGTRGITTAGHCNNPQSYAGTNLPFQWESVYGDLDAQWHTAPGLSVVNKAYDGQWDTSSPYYRSITAKKTWAQQVVNEWVCHYGRTTRYGCGSIVEVYMTASHVANTGNRYIRVAANGVDLSSPGDSGGPWYSGSTAYGTMVAVQNDTHAVYMATNFLEELGLFILLN